MNAKIYNIKRTGGTYYYFYIITRINFKSSKLFNIALLFFKCIFVDKKYICNYMYVCVRVYVCVCRYCVYACSNEGVNLTVCCFPSNCIHVHIVNRFVNCFVHCVEFLFRWESHTGFM